MEPIIGVVTKGYLKDKQVTIYLNKHWAKIKIYCNKKLVKDIKELTITITINLPTQIELIQKT